MSTVDDFLAPFHDLNENYPGSRHKRRTQAVAATPADEEQRWDRTPVIHKVDGKDVEFFHIGALADALLRKPATIRKWLNTGVLPAARFRTKGNTVKGSRRLWTRAQIEGIRRIAREEGVLVPSANGNVSATQFTERVNELFRVLKANGE